MLLKFIKSNVSQADKVKPIALAKENFIVPVLDYTHLLKWT